MSTVTTQKRALVIGGGVAGQRAALDLVDVGIDVLLVEEADTLGGTVAQLGTMFPLHNCLLCRGETRHGPGCTRPTVSARLLDRGRPDTLAVWTRSHVAGIQGEAGDFTVAIRRAPRHVDPARCIGCDRCAAVCPKEMPDPFESGLTTCRAAYRPAERSVPDAYAIDRGPWCDGCGRCVAACPTEAIDLEEPERLEEVRVGAVVLATGMRLFDAAASREYGYGRFPNVFSGMEMERMGSPAGPGEGRIVRRSDGLPPVRIAWLQCVGSRDRVRDYCSSFCCGYATRQAATARRILPDSQAHIFMMDDRVFARGFSTTYDPLRREHGIRLERSRLSVLREDPATRDLLLQSTAEDGRVTEERFGMVVLSVGAEAASGSAGLLRVLGLEPDGFGFLRTGTLAPTETSRAGIFVAGSAAGPMDIGDATTTASAAAARVAALLGARVVAAAASGSSPSSDARSPATRRIGVFACDCAGEVGGVLDLAACMDHARSLEGVARAGVVPFGCLPEGIEAIRSAIGAHSLTDVVIGACSRRTYAPLFEGALGARVGVVSLREECAWVHGEDPAGATRKARELLRTAVERSRRASRPEPHRLGTPEPAALVVGGGLAGLTAAAWLADAGVDVHLVERELVLGGNAARLGRTPEGRSVPEILGELVSRVRGHPRIALHLSSEVVRLAGFRGELSAVVRPAGGASAERVLRVGATVVATGGAEYRGPAHGLGGFADGSSRVLTLLELGQVLRDQPESLSPVQSVAFVGCVGPWDEPDSGVSWRCSRACCETMVRQARSLKESHPGRMVTVLVREVNTYGFREEEYTAARKAGVLFVRSDPADPPRLERHDGRARLVVTDLALGESLAVPAELTVLAAAMLPRPEAARTAAVLGIPLREDGFLREWEPKTRGVASLEPGVFVCGLAHGPKPVREVVTQALAAAHGAFAHIAAERVVHPEEVASIDVKRCASCLTCVRVCPYGVPRVGGDGFPLGWPRSRPHIDEVRCQGCGTCVAECPARAIALESCGDEQLVASGAVGGWLAGTGGAP